MLRVHGTLPNKTLKKTQHLLRRMNDQSYQKYYRNGDKVEIHTLNTITINGQISLSSDHMVKQKPDNVMQGEAWINILNPLLLKNCYPSAIDTTSIHFKKSNGRLTPLSSRDFYFLSDDVVKVINKHLDAAIANFDKKGVVKKEFFSADCYTEQYAKKHPPVCIDVTPEYREKREPDFLDTLENIFEKIDKFNKKIKSFRNKIFG